VANCSECGMTLQQGDRFCSGCGTAVPETAAEAAPEAAAWPTQPEPDRTPVERFLEADWRSAALAAVPAVVVLVLGATLAAAGLWQSDDAVKLLGQGDLKDAGAGYHNAAATTLAQAFRSRLHFDGGLTTGLMPLSLTIATLAALYAATRRTTRIDRSPRERALHGLRTGAVFALFGWLLSLFGDWTSRGGQEADTSSGRAFLWALLFGAATALAAALWRTDGRDLARDRTEVWRRWVQWRLPTEGALVTLGSGLLLGGVAAVVIAYLEKDTLGTTNAQLTSLLPYALAVLVNLGVAVMHVGMLGNLMLPRVPGADPQAVSLYDLRGASPAYWLLLLLPVVSLLAGAWWIKRRGRGLDERGLQRAAYRMALPLTVLWCVLLFCSRIYRAASAGDALVETHTGPRVIEGVALMVLWGILGGWVAMAGVRRVAGRKESRRSRLQGVLGVPGGAPPPLWPPAAPPPTGALREGDTLSLPREEQPSSTAAGPAESRPTDRTQGLEFEE
jgi:hypothetical protein